MTDPMAAADANLAILDENAELWAQHVGWREQLDQLAAMSTAFAGKRVEGPGGAELRLLILRQRNLIDRWVRQAFAEGFVAGSDPVAASPPGHQAAPPPPPPVELDPVLNAERN